MNQTPKQFDAPAGPPLSRKLRLPSPNTYAIRGYYSPAHLLRI
jgi:hypothetical protein